MSVGLCYATTRTPVIDRMPTIRFVWPSTLRGANLGRVALALLVFSALAFKASVHISILEQGYEVEELRSQALQYDQILRQHRLQYDYLTSPQRLIVESRARLGLQPSKPQQVRRLPE